MFYVYLLRNKSDKRLYFGYTSDLKDRVRQHNAKGKWKLIYYEAYLAEQDARVRERKLKHYGQTRTHLKTRLKVSLSM